MGRAGPSSAEGGRAARRGHRDDIQGLRAVAVLLVVLGHAGVPFLEGGFVGVDVFFVLSGFLITGLLVQGAERDGRVSLREFYARRARRILPAAALTLLATQLAAIYLLNVVRAREALLDSVWAVGFAANVHFARQGVDYFAEGQPASAIQHYWSLAVEEQFYLVWPVVVSLAFVGAARRRRNLRAQQRPEAHWRHLRARRLRAVIVLGGVASLLWSVIATSRSDAAYFSTGARVWELALGAALAIDASRVLRLPDRLRAALGWAGALAIVAAASLFSASTPFPGFAALLPTVGTCLVIAAGMGNDGPRLGLGRVLGCRPLRYVGDRSYALYLWHWPVLVIGAHVAGRTLSIGTNLVLLAGALALSVLSYRVVENPIRRAPLHQPVRTGAILWGASVLLVVSVAMANLRPFDADPEPLDAVATAGQDADSSLPVAFGVREDPSAPGVIPEVVAAVHAARSGVPIPSSLSPSPEHLLRDIYRIDRRDCFASRGDTSSATVCSIAGSGDTMVVFGDSHARQWMPAVEWVARSDGWRVEPIIELGCAPAQYLDGCRAYVEWAVERVRALRPDAILIGGVHRSRDEAARARTVAGIRMLVAAMQPFARRVVVIGDPPAHPWQPVDCVLGRGATRGDCASALADESRRLYEDVAVAARHGGAAFLDTLGWFCFDGLCPMVIGDTIAYRDPDHISQTYALTLRELFRDVLTRALQGPRPARPDIGSEGPGT